MDTVVQSMDTVVYVDEHRMLRSDCTDAHADLDLRCPQIAQGPFSCIEYDMRPVQTLYPHSLIRDFAVRLSNLLSTEHVSN